MKVSEITEDEIKNYLRLSEASTDDASFLTTILSIAKIYMSNHTGIPIKKTDTNGYKLYYCYENGIKSFYWYDETNNVVYKDSLVSTKLISDLIEVKKDLDDYEDFVILVYVLCEDMFDNRTLYIDSSNLNNVASAILNMHSENLL